MFEDYAWVIGNDYFNVIKHYGLSIDFCDFITKQSEKKFNNFCLASKNMNLINEKNIPFREMSNSECVDTAYLLLLDSTKLDYKCFLEMREKIIKTNEGEYYDGVNIGIIDSETKEETSMIQVPYLNKTISSICLGHESIHYLISKNRKKILVNDHYTEVLPIFYELLLASQMEKDGIENNMLQKTEMVRLDSIKFHAGQLIQVEQMLKELGYLMDEQQKNIVEYHKHLSYTYLISWLYANYMFDLYLSDKKIIDKTDNILLGENSIPSLLE